MSYSTSCTRPKLGRMLFFLVLITMAAFQSCQGDTEQNIPEKEQKQQTNKQEKKLVKKKTTKAPVQDSEDTYARSANIDMSLANRKIAIDKIDYSLLEELLHQEINKVRKANQLPILSKNTILRNAAIDQNQYCLRNTDLTHYQNSPNKKTIKDRVKFHGGGFQAMAENLIYEGFTVRTINGVKAEVITPTYQELVKTMTKNWLNSPGHRANIMEKDVDKVGTAIAYNPKNHAVYATQVFGKLW